MPRHTSTDLSFQIDALAELIAEHCDPECEVEEDAGWLDAALELWHSRLPSETTAQQVFDRHYGDEP